MRSIPADGGLLLLFPFFLFFACTSEPEPTASQTESLEQPSGFALPTAPREFLEAFMQARIQGEEARARLFLGSEALSQFEQGSGELTLLAPRGEIFRSWDLLSFAPIDANSYEARVRIQSSQGLVEEFLFIGPGPGVVNDIRPLTIRGAERVISSPDNPSESPKGGSP